MTRDTCDICRKEVNQAMALSVCGNCYADLMSLRANNERLHDDLVKATRANIEVAKLNADLMEIVTEILDWYDEHSSPNVYPKISCCPVCDEAWWRDMEQHKRDCWIPSLKMAGKQWR
jgi:hypothetical protein